MQAVGWARRQPACPSKHVVRRMGPSPSVWQTPTTRTVRYQELSPRSFATLIPPAQRGVVRTLRVRFRSAQVGRAVPSPPQNVPTPPLRKSLSEFRWIARRPVLGAPVFNRPRPAAPPTTTGPPLHSASHQPQGGYGVSPAQPASPPKLSLPFVALAKNGESEGGSLSEATLGFGATHQEANPRFRRTPRPPAASATRAAARVPAPFSPYPHRKAQRGVVRTLRVRFCRAT